MAIRKVAGALAISLLIVAAGCGGGASHDAGAAGGSADSAVLNVHVVNYPLQYFAERIGGDLVRVEFPTPDDVDPAFWQPELDELSGYQQADLVLLNGAGYAKWLDNVSLRSSSLVDASAGFLDRQIPVDNLETHSHGPQGEHEHGGVAFTTWLDLRLAVEQARAIEAAFREAMPAGSETFRSGLESLERDLLDLDRALRGMLEGRNVPLLGSHPVYQYLARAYGLKIESVHFEPDEFPGETAWRELEALQEQTSARWMLWEARPLDRTAQRLQELGVGSVVFDPCGNRPGEGDFLTVQRENFERLRQVYGAAS